MLSKLKAFFAANNIQRRLLLIISMFIFSSIILVSLFSHLRFVADYTDQSAKDIQQVVEQVALNVDTYIDELARLCLSPYYNSSVMNYLDTRSSSSQEALDKRRSIEDYLRQVMITPREDILVDLQYRGDVLVISVKDNGAGMSTVTLQQLQSRLDNCESEKNTEFQTSGIGLINIQKRIRFQFGSPYGITLSSEEGSGTTVTLSIPRSVKPC